MESSISLEETNKIRISLGLKPLVDDGKPVDVKQKAAEDNYAEERDRASAAKRTSEIAQRIQKKKNQRELNKRLVGATLGDDDGADDTAKWIKRSKKKEKELAKKRLEALDAMDNVHQEEYTEKDLAGLKVSHDLDALEDGEDRILTLKDSRVLDNEEDELQNIDMAEEEGDKKRHELKTKRQDYTGYDDEEFGPTAIAGMKRSVLAKYDEDINGGESSSMGFRLGDAVKFSSSNKMEDSDGPASVNKSLLSIDYSKNLEMSDYAQEGDVGFKKPKSKKKRANRRQVDADPTTTAGPSSSTTLTAAEMDVDDVKPAIPDMDANFVDDDDLQAALAKARRRKTTKVKMLSAEEIADRVARERQAEETSITNANNSAQPPPARNPNVLEFDDTSEFVRSITYTPTAAPPVKMEPIIVKIDTRSAAQEDDEDGDDGDEAINEMDVHVKEEEEEGEEIEMDMDEDATSAMLNAIEAAIKGGGDVGVEVKTEEHDESAMGTATQQKFSSGMASTLAILRQQGLLQTASQDVLEREATQKAKDAWLASYRHKLAQRELSRLRQKSSSADQATREWENRQRDATESREALELFADYKPDVEIRYHDEDGRVLTTKEAWKALSHKFHGKGSGRMKTEKRLKKIADERKREAMGSGDTPLSMQAAFQIRQEKAGQAHMVLSVGNRGAVPQATEFLDAPLSKKDKAGKNKKKDLTKPAQISDITAGLGIGGAVLGEDAHIPPGASGAVISGEATSSSTAPIRSGFMRIGSAEASASAGGTPVPEDRGKVAFGFSAIGKRKAGDEADGHAPKRR